jgi:hypothetical protein
MTNNFNVVHRGGAAFVATQALGWALFSSALTSLIWIVWEMVVGVASCVRSWAISTVCVMGGAYLVHLPTHSGLCAPDPWVAISELCLSL